MPGILGSGASISTERAIQAIHHHGMGLAEAAAVTDPAGEVISCPGWNVSDLVWHIRGVHYFWAAIAEGKLADPDEVAYLERPSDFSQLLADYRAGVDHIAEVLAAADQSSPVWTWASQKDIAFVTRHQVQEAAVHRWDAETAAGQTLEIEPDIAVDSVDEFLQFSAPSRKDNAGLFGSVHLHTTDVEGEWLVSDTEGTYRFERGHSKGDGALRAKASDLLLILYRRIPVSTGEVVGDSELVERFVNESDLD